MDLPGEHSAYSLELEALRSSLAPADLGLIFPSLGNFASSDLGFLI